MSFFFLIRINYPFFLPFYLAKIYIQKTIHVYQRSDFHCPSEIPLLPNSRRFFSEKHLYIILFLYFCNKLCSQWLECKPSGVIFVGKNNNSIS